MTLQRRLAVWGACAALAGAGCSGAGASSPASQYADDPDALARGEGLFKGACGAYCHGLKPDNRDAVFLFDCSWKNGASDAEIFGVISNGVGGTQMPAWGGALSEEDRWKLVAFLRSRANCP
jgi:mono/diheme cytochrome c family protein